MFKVIKLNGHYKVNSYISKCLYSYIIENMSHTIIIGKENDECFEYVKNQLWQGTNKHSFPYMDSDAEYANLSPLVCSTSMSLVNSPVNIIFINFVITEEIINKIKDLNNILIIADNYDMFNEACNMLSTMAIQFQEIRDNEDKNNKHEASKSSKIQRNDHSGENKYNTYKNNKNMQSNNNDSYKGYKTYTKDGVPQYMQKTILVIKPHVVKNKQHFNMLIDVEKEGFSVTYIGRKQYSKDIWERIYIHHQGEPFYDKMCEYLSSNYVYICIIEKADAIEAMRAILGDKDPKKAHTSSLRYKYGLNLDDNGVHASLNIEEYNKDKLIFFASSGFNRRY